MNQPAEEDKFDDFGRQHLGLNDVKELIDEQMISTVQQLFQNSDLERRKDAHYTFFYKHDAFRIGMPLWSRAPALFDRLCGVIRWAGWLIRLFIKGR